MATDFKGLFGSAEIHFRLVDDFKSESWKKLCESASLGAITCLSGETCRIFQDEEVKDLYKRMLEESVVVAKADGAQIPSDFYT